MAVERTRVLEENSWLDEQTAWVGVSFVVVNPDLGSFTTLSANLLLPPSGEIIPSLSATTFAMEPYRHPSVMAIDIFWLCLWFGSVAICCGSLIKALKSGAEGRHEYVRNPRTYMGWVSVFGGALAMLLWWMTLDRFRLAKDALMEVSRGFKDTYCMVFTCLRTIL